MTASLSNGKFSVWKRMCGGINIYGFIQSCSSFSNKLKLVECFQATESYICFNLTYQIQQAKIVSFTTRKASQIRFETKIYRSVGIYRFLLNIKQERQHSVRCSVFIYIIKGTRFYCCFIFIQLELALLLIGWLCFIYTSQNNHFIISKYRVPSIQF